MREHRWRRRQSWVVRTKALEHHSLLSSGGTIVPLPIDTALLSAMMLFANIQPPSPGAKVENGFFVFQGASARLLHRSAGCESAQSGSRPSLRRPWGTASCSRYERSPDTPCCCAASSRVVPPTCVPPPPWPLPWPCYDNGVDIFFAQSFIQAILAVCAASTSNIRRKLLPCLLIAPSRCMATRTVFARNESQIAGHLFAAPKPRHLADGHHEGQRRDRAPLPAASSAAALAGGQTPLFPPPPPGAGFARPAWPTAPADLPADTAAQPWQR